MWWFGQKSALPQGMIDLHNHISPGIDDGASNDEDTLAMLRLFKGANFSQLAITSHLGHPLFPHVTTALIQERVLHVQQLAVAHQIDLEIHSGAEIYYGEKTLEQLEKGLLLSLGGTSYYLIEFPASDLMSHMKEIAFQLTTKGIRPILAHPERYTALQRKPDLLLDWQRAGWLMQLDVASLASRQTQKVAKKWLTERAFDLAASDLHRSWQSPEQFQKMFTNIVNIVGEIEANRLLVENPKRILADEYTLEAIDRED